MTTFRLSQVVVDEVLEHFHRSIGLLARNHMPCSVHYVVVEVVLVRSHPALQTASRVLYCLLLSHHLPPNLTDVFFSGNVRHHSIHIPRVQQYLESCLLESPVEERDSRRSICIRIANFITTRKPFCRSHMELLLDSWIIEKSKQS